MSNSSKILCMSSLPASMKRICSRIADKKWQHHFPHYKPMVFFRRSRAANSSVSIRIRANFELLQALMHVIITCKYEKDPIKTAEKKWQHRFSIITLSVAMETSGRIWPNIKLVQALMYVIVTCKFEMDPTKNS